MARTSASCRKAALPFLRRGLGLILAQQRLLQGQQRRGHVGERRAIAQQLVGGVEGDEVAPAHPAGDRRLPAVVREQPLDEALPERRILEPPLLLHRQERQPREEDGGEGADPVAPGRPAAPGVDADALHPAGRRVLLRDVAVELEGGELPDAALGEAAHRLGVIRPAPLADEATVCRCFLEQIPANCNVAYIFNPKLTVIELLRAICDEFHVPVPAGAQTVKDYVDPLNAFLLAQHAAGRNNVLIIDEAQNLSAEVLEQLRLPSPPWSAPACSACRTPWLT